MGKVQAGRFTAEHDGDIVVFLIGMRVNKLWKLRQWLPVGRAMGAMLKELSVRPDSPLLGFNNGFLFGGPVVVQYWRSVEELNDYARNPDQRHLPAWRAFNKAVGTDGTVGIWHETYVVKAGQWECIYGNMPVVGLAAATAHVPVSKRGQAAAKRMGISADDVPAEPVPA
jgi:hypothetical protein